MPQIAAFHGKEPNLLSKGVRLGLSQKSRRWAVLSVLLIVGTFWDGPRMTPFHNKLRCDAAVLVVFTHNLRHITQSLLAAGKLTTLDDVKLVVGGIGLKL